MTRVLVVEDERGFGGRWDQSAGARLRGDPRRGWALRPERGLGQPPDAVVLDLGLPDMDGVEVIEGLRGWSEAPIIVLSARSGEPDKVVALDAGADDYVTKPFGMDELLARLRAALRRPPADEDLPSIETETSAIDLAAKQASGRDGGAVRLTPTEWQVVEVLVRNEGKLVSQRQLLKEVWGPPTNRDQLPARHMAELRRKLEPDPAASALPVTEPGMGYRFLRTGSAGE